MSWLNHQVDDGPRVRHGGAGAEIPESAAHLVLPALLGVVLAGVVQLVMFALVLAVTLATFDYNRDFGTGDAVVISIFGAIGLGVACALGAWVCARRARLRQVPASWVRRAALATGLGVGVLAVVLGLALAVRGVTIPIYAAGVIAGSVLGARFGR